jgi:phenylalanyl-tRNA synthetase beta chain
MIQTIKTNVLNGHHNFVLFEVADVYFQHDKSNRHLAIGMTGKFNYYNLKAHVDAILRLYNIDPLTVEYNLDPEVIEEIHPYINAEILIGRKCLGFIYKLNPRFEAKNKITDTFIAEINLDLLYKMANLRIENHEFSKYQASTRDLSVELPISLSYQEVIKALVKDVKNLTGYELTDIYQDQLMRSKHVQAVAISFTFNNLKQQMTDEQIAKS